MKILLAYFSATRNTEKVAEVIKGQFIELGAEVDMFDITSYSDRQKESDFRYYQAFVFGMPIHSVRSPRIVRQWFETLDGQGKKCSTFFTYGGFGVHPAHYSTGQILKKQGFLLVSSAEFLGKHTFNLGGWSALEDRPDFSDFDLAREYTKKTYKRFTGEDGGMVGKLEKTKYTEKQLEGFENFRFMVVSQLPTREGEDCSMCMQCEELCPTQAINAEKGEAEREKCIVCLRCICICPEGILKINDLRDFWKLKLEMEGETEESLRNKKGKLYF